LICNTAYDKKAEDIVVMDMGQRSSFCSYFVVMSASSSVRVKAIADAIEEAILGRDGQRARHKEGYAEATWVLLDYGDVVAHIFYADTRRFYDLEKLWGDAPRRHFVGGPSER